MVIDSKEFSKMLNGYVEGRVWLNDVEVDIEGGPNELDPLTMLRMNEAEPTIDNLMPIATQTVLNKHVTFTKKGKEILSFTYVGGDLADKFRPAPYLLDLLLKLSYGIMLKKLTPPSESSETEERQ